MIYPVGAQLCQQNQEAKRIKRIENQEHMMIIYSIILKDDKIAECIQQNHDDDERKEDNIIKIIEETILIKMLRE